MQKLLVMTDLHIRPPGARIIGLDPAERLRLAIRHALTHHPDALCLVLTGDLTHAGTTEEYRHLAAILADIPVPVIPMLGNHDNRLNFLGVFADAPLTASGHVQQARRLGETWLITLDTLIGPPFGWTHLGRLDAARMAWLDEKLTEAGSDPVIVCAHHPPMRLGLPAMDAMMLEDGPRLIGRLRAHPGPVHLILGHIHRTISGHAQGLPFTIFKSTCHQGPLDLVSMDSSLSLDEPGAYGVILFGGGQVIAHSQDVGLPDVPLISGYGDP